MPASLFNRVRVVTRPPFGRSGYTEYVVLLDEVEIARRISFLTHADAVSIAGAHLFPAPPVVLDFRPKAGRPRADARGRGEFDPEAA